MARGLASSWRFFFLAEHLPGTVLQLWSLVENNSYINP
ncbi:hypothetical protein NOC27_3129 [Nitrosococcus oceani AFC27]|nr:hypothetical protein NOC27_3129 [Nitrosococcus oceani AFC27]